MRDQTAYMQVADGQAGPGRAAAQPRNPDVIKLHGPAAFEGMRRAGRLAAETLDFIAGKVRPGVTTGELDRLCHDYIVGHGAIPAPLGYRDFPRSICTSVNHVVCHGIPGDKRLDGGDILNIDVTVILDGWHGDTSRMFFVGKPDRKAERLCEITFEAMWRGIRAVKPGARLTDIGLAIQDYARGQGCSVVEDFCGHGLGQVFHDAPNILHYRDPVPDRRRQEKRGGPPNVELRPGMFFTVEPMINLGTHEVIVLRDGWTAVTRDKKLSAQFEHSIGVTETGVEVFTLSPAGLDKPPYASPAG